MYTWNVHKDHKVTTQHCWTLLFNFCNKTDVIFSIPHGPPKKTNPESILMVSLPFAGVHLLQCVRNYPLACVSINITKMIIEALLAGQLGYDLVVW